MMTIEEREQARQISIQFSDLISMLVLEKAALRDEAGGLGRYVALALTDIEKAYAVYQTYVLTQEERNEIHHGN